MSRFILLILCVLPGSGCMTMSISSLEKSIVYQPVQLSPRNDMPLELLEKSPPLNNNGFEDARIEVNESTFLHGWFAEVKQPRAVILYCHGNAGNVENCADTLRMFRDKLNVTILAFDYCGYGHSSKTSEICEVLLIRDARSARAWLSKRTGVAEKDIVLCGYSLGGGVAVELAAKDGARGLILERTFTSIPDVASNMIPILPIRWLMESRYDSLSKIKNYRGPLLQTHGDADRVVPYKLGKKLFDAANEPKAFVRIPDGDHNDSAAPEYIAALDRFFNELNKVPPVAGTEQAPELLR